MTRPIEPLVEIVGEWSKNHLPALYRLMKDVQDIKSYSMSWLAHHSRRFGSTAVVVVGTLSTVYALYLFAFASLAPDKPKPSHDVILKNRFSSPRPSPDIVIVDINERSLAILAPEHGRWPWSRQVLADGLQKLSDAEVKSVIFNILISDADKNNPDGDSTLAYMSTMMRPVAFPLIRLNPANDSQSQLKAQDIPGFVKGKEFKDGTTLAAILPLMPAMQDRLGIANQHPDADGIVRKYNVIWDEKTYQIPSLVGRAIELGGDRPSTSAMTLSLNWRNKRGRYQRISFSDLLSDKLDSSQAQSLRHSYVVLGVSAPGLGQVKPTSTSATEDDSEILATALDDALNDTHLRTMPTWLVLLINIAAIWTLVVMSTRAIQNNTVNRLFILTQSAFGGITLISVSYTPYLLDFSDSMSFGLAVFGAIKLVQALDDRWSRAKPGFRRTIKTSVSGQVWILAYRTRVLSNTVAKQLQRQVEVLVGLQSVVRVDDLYGGESFIRAHCAEVHCLVALVPLQSQAAMAELMQRPEHIDCLISQYDLEQAWNLESKSLQAELAPWILESTAKILRQQ